MDSVLFGLDCDSSNGAIRNVVFDAVHRTRYCSMATLPAAGGSPGMRIIDFMRSRTDGLIYFGTSAGKACGADLAAQPRVALGGALVTEDTGEPEHRMLLGFRITGEVREADNAGAIGEYWERNPGSRRMWRKNPGGYTVYCLFRGEGELYQIYRDDRIYRLRFGFGGDRPRPFRYRINVRACTGCGACRNACTADIIEITGGSAGIPHHHCYECGACFTACPHGAVEMIPSIASPDQSPGPSPETRAHGGSAGCAAAMGAVSPLYAGWLLL